MKKQKFLVALMAALMIIMSVPIYLMPASAKTALGTAKEYTYHAYKSTNAKSVRFAKTSVSVYYGSTTTLKLLNNTKKIAWSTSNKAVATVNSKGVVTGKGLGSCTITAKVSSKSYKCKVTVKDRNQKATTSFKLTGSGVFIYGENSASASFVLKSYPAAKVTVYIVNKDGKGVYKKTFTNVKKGTTYKFNWNGKKSDGKVASAGNYRMKVVVGTTNSYSSYISFMGKNDFSGGNGTKSNPFLVTSAYQFAKMIKYPKAYYKQTKTIDFKNAGINTKFSESVSFGGVYDGNGKTIKNMVAASPLFNYIGETATIKNLTFSNCSTTSKNSAILVRYSDGKISNCKFTNCTVTVNSAGEGGIIAVVNYGDITNCSVSGAVSSKGSGNRIGAIAGVNHEMGKIINCTSAANVTGAGTAKNKDNVGGIAGDNGGVIKNCKASGSISALSENTGFCGGIAGYNYGSVGSSNYTGPTACNLAGEDIGFVI